MSHQDEKSSCPGAIMNAFQHAFIVVLITGVGASLQFGTAAVAASPGTSSIIRRIVDGGHQRNGNGYRNKNTSIMNSPNRNNGVQQSVVADAGGINIILNGFCKKRRYCRMPQRAVVVVR
jgi:hypothetical protein